MPDRYLLPLTMVTAGGAAIVGGVFLAFSTFVMTGIRALPPGPGLTAMQSINRAAPTPVFMLALLGTAAASLVLGLSSLFDLAEPAAVHRVIGSALYLLAIALTIVYHIPRNNALDTVDPAAPDAARRWAEYAPGWVSWNHLRTIAAIAGAAILILAVRVGERMA